MWKSGIIRYFNLTSIAHKPRNIYMYIFKKTLFALKNKLLDLRFIFVM